MERAKKPTSPLVANGNIGNQKKSPKKKSSSKREIIEISSDESSNEQPVSKVARTSSKTSSENPSRTSRNSFGAGPYHGSMNSQLHPESSDPASIGAGDDEFGVDDIVVWSQEDNGVAEETLERYGTLGTKIVGIRYYNGHATLGEHVLLRREPSNPYDRNAIRVDNVQRQQIGHIPRQVAAKLARFMDDGSLALDARLSGRRNEFDCPLEVGLYGTSDQTRKEELKMQLKGEKLPVNELDKREREQKQKEKQQKAAELKKVAQKGAGVQGSSNQQWQAGLTTGDGLDEKVRSDYLEEIATTSERFNPRAIKDAMESLGAGEDVLSKMPMAPQPKSLATELLPYQRQGLAWLIDRENPKLPSKNSDGVVQMWKRSTENRDLFTNISTNFSSQNPTLASGGILADDMGLGKTVEMISLILNDIDLNAKAKDGSKTTLIIAPLSVMSNWTKQIKHHVEPSKALRVFIYHGNTRKDMTAEEFSEYDVVITTYGTLASDYFSKGKNSKPAAVPRSKGLYSARWRRIVLDEGHNIRNPSTKGALAATAVVAKSRWALTGTPIINNLKDLYSLVRFIGLTGGLENLEVFNTVLMRPLKNGDENATLLLQALMATLCLRRRKEMSFVDLKLPELKEYIHRIQFKAHERKKYDALQDEAKGYLKKYQARSAAGGKSAQDTYRHLLEVLLRMRQVCNHWQLCGERVTNLMAVLEEQKTVELNAENRKALQDMLQLSIESREDCPICLDDLTGHSPVITHCGHIFDRECIMRVIETQQKCPMCRATLPDEDHLVEPARDLGANDSQDLADDDGSGPSSKLEALLNILSASHKKSGTKTIVFSQWCRFLDLVEPHLKEAGYKYVRLDGSMNASAREASLQALDHDSKTTILLASLGVASVGLNLTVANQVILSDTWWAPAIEDQAVDRVHRLGQKKDCTVWRLVMEDSIEERTLQIQADKRKLAMQAFQEKSSKRGQGTQARLGDIRKLLA